MVSADTVLTYRQLDRQASSLADALRAQGVGPDVVVAVAVERSPAFVVAALAVVRAGGAYLPIDVSQPIERSAFMLADASVSCAIATPEAAGQLSPYVRHIVLVESPTGPVHPSNDSNVSNASNVSHDSNVSNVSNVSNEDNLAYVIYTSGSTGRPKGVAISRRNLQNLVDWHCRAFAVTSADRATAMAFPSFDAAVWEVWPYLAAGASLHFPSDDVRVTPELLRDWLLAERISVSFAVTPLAERLIELDWPLETPLRLLLTGGDTLTRHPRPDLPFGLVNNYGPTETTVVATSGLVPAGDRDRSPSIGRPIDHVEVYVVDRDLKQVAPGVPGELCIGGAGVARGYINDAAATAARFVPNPFGHSPNDRLYRTGDLVRMEADGQLSFLGRLDDQIKIRGHRIEPAEIVRALTSHRSVHASAVVARDDESGSKRLVAYIVSDDEQELTSAELIDHLRALLPDYMIPAAFVSIDQLPTTASGKLDSHALPEPTTERLLRDRARPRQRSITETRVSEILSALLGLPDVAPDENFFLLGGHSLLGAQVIARLRDAFGVDVSLRRLFEAPTAEGLAQEIERLIDQQVAAYSDAEVTRLLTADRASDPGRKP